MQKLESWVDTQQIPARIRYFLGLVPQPPTCWGIKLRKALRLLAILSGAGSRKYTPMVGENVMLVVQRYNEEKLQMFGKILSKW